MASDSIEKLKKISSLDPSLKIENFPEFKKEIKALLEASEFEIAAKMLQQYTQFDWNFTTLKSLHKILKICKKNIPVSDQALKVSVVSNQYTTTQLTWFLDLFLHCFDIESVIYEAAFGVLRHELISEDSGLYKFQPDIIILVTSPRDIINFPSLAASKDERKDLVNHEVEFWSALWDKLNTKLKCQIIQNIFESPSSDSLGHYALMEPNSRSSYIESLNQKLISEARSRRNILFHNINQLCAEHGQNSWSSPRFFYDSKLPCGPEYISHYAHSIASIIRASRGKSKKVLVLDLDNTLWGGVIGDDGLGGISLSQGDPLGEAFIEFQKYLLNLKERGIVLAVCSKNDEENAKLPFEKHHDMVLKLSDLSSFKANWTDKATNLQEIANELNIGLDSMVFVDDNPSERALVRRLLPEISVPELSEDPSGYIHRLEKERYFEITTFSEEDIKRSRMYAENAQRKMKIASVHNIEKYLQSINMQCHVDGLNEQNKERVLQLINKSNQFNLTTKRYTAAELQNFMEQPNFYGLTFRLIDDFGDNGLIAVVLLNEQDTNLEIDSWLMSCRVLGRGMEQFTMQSIYNLAQARGKSTIKGIYNPTPKNKLVASLYRKLGFKKVLGSNEEPQFWEFPLKDTKTGKWNTYINEVKK